MTKRDNPYGAFNFIVEIDGTASGGFDECTIPSATVEVVEYREGNEKQETPRKVTGLFKYDNITLKRGITGSTELFDWFKQTRDGVAQRKEVKVTLLDEKRVPVLAWVFHRAFPVKYTGPILKAKGNDVAIEEVHLSYESMDMTAP